MATSRKALRRLGIGIVMMGFGCGGQSQGEVASSADAGDAGGDSMDAPEASPSDAGSEADAPTLIDPPANGPCVRVSALPAPVGELPYGRMFFSGPGELWSVSGSTPYPDGGTFLWTQDSDWTLLDLPGSSGVWAFAGVAALATLDDAPAFGVTTKLPSLHLDISASDMCASWFVAEQLGSPWIGDNGNCSRVRARASLVYPNGVKFRTLTLLPDADVARVSDVGETVEVLPFEGWLDDYKLMYLRYTAVGRWHVRSGRLTKVGVIDLDALRMEAADGVPAIDGYGAVAVRDHMLWLYGADDGGAPVLARIDPATATATLFDAIGLPRPGLPNIEQDLLAHDGTRLWKLRFDEGSAIVGTLDPVTQDAQVHPMVGDVEAARSLFIPAQADLLEPDVLSEELNGFRPPESLMALPIGDGEIVVARQWGEFAAVRVSLECP